MSGFTAHEVALSLAFGYGVQTALHALNARTHQIAHDLQIAGVQVPAIAGMAAAAWYLANPGFQVELARWWDKPRSLLAIAGAVSALALQSQEALSSQGDKLELE